MVKYNKPYWSHSYIRINRTQTVEPVDDDDSNNNNTQYENGKTRASCN